MAVGEQQRLHLILHGDGGETVEMKCTAAFGGNLHLWLLSRENNADKRLVITMDARRFATEQPPEFRAEVQSLDQQSELTPLVAEIVDSNGDVTPLNINTESSSVQSSRMTQAIRGRIARTCSWLLSIASTSGITRHNVATRKSWPFRSLMKAENWLNRSPIQFI